MIGRAPGTTSPDASVGRIAEVAAVVRTRWCALTILFAAATLADGAELPRVLMLFANDRLLPANQRVDEGFRRVLDPKGNQTGVTIFTEFLDVPRFVGAEHEQMKEEYLRKRYRAVPPGVLVVLGVEAANFWFARRDRLFPGTPVVLGGVTVEELRSLAGLSGVAGLPMDVTVTPVVESLLAMRPQTRRIVLVHGSSEFDRRGREVALRQCRPFTDRVEITVFPELPLEELKARLAALPPEAAVLYLTYFQSPTGETYTPARMAREIAAASAVPVMGSYDTYVGTGVLGVVCSPFEDEGAEIGRLTRRVLSGESPQSLGILRPNPTRLIVDDRQVKRWGIKYIPVGTEVRFHEPALWEQHRELVLAVLAIVLVQAILIALLLGARRRARELDRSLAEQRRELAHLSRLTMLSTLSGSLAHELNQPLGIILSNAQAAETLLKSDEPDLGELRDILADIVTADRRASEVIKRLRAFLKRGEPNRRPQDLNEIVEDAVQLSRSDLSAHAVSLACELTPGLPLVQGDRVQLQQVILNLIMNACDAMTENKSDARQMTINSMMTDHCVRISVRDAGCGLPADVESIFQPLVTTKNKGLGLGLAISRSIAESHGGKLWAEAQSDGALLHLDLPVEEATTS